MDDGQSAPMRCDAMLRSSALRPLPCQAPSNASHYLPSKTQQWNPGAYSGATDCQSQWNIQDLRHQIHCVEPHQASTRKSARIKIAAGIDGGTYDFRWQTHQRLLGMTHRHDGLSIGDLFIVVLFQFHLVFSSRTTMGKP